MKTVPTAVLTKTEVYDVDMVQKLVRHDGVCQQDKKKLKAYRDRRNNGNHVDVTYVFGEQYQSIKKGRLYARHRLGCEGFPRDIRACLYEKYYWDVDMENAQPVLLVTLAKKLGVLCPALNEYCEKREEVLAEIMRAHNYSRDEAKSLCISVIFGGYRDHHPLLPQMYNELKTLSVLVSDENPDLLQIIRKDKELKEKQNPQGSCLAMFIQNEERLILETIDKFLSSKGRSMDGLMHDGGLVRKLPNETAFPSELLRETEAFVLTTNGYPITLAVKPMKHTFVFSDDTLLPSTLLINDEYAGKTFVSLVGDRLRKVDGSLWVEDSQGLWSNSSESLRMLVAEYSSDLVFKQSGPMGIKIFDYGGNEDKIPKMLKQAYLHAKKGDLPLQLAYSLVETSAMTKEPLELFLDLVSLLTNHQEPLKDYVLNWFAHILQKPFEIPGVALIVTGRKGYGKDTLFDFFGKYVLGSLYFTNYTENAQLFDHFDTMKIHKLLVKVEEADRAICMKNSSALKGMITADKIIVNPKNKQPYQCSNFCRYVLTTNKGNPVEFSDGERRYVLLPSSGERKGHFDYWTKVREVLFSDEGGKQVAEYLIERDISSFVPQKLPPNEYQDAVIESEVSIEERFLDQWDGEETTNKVLMKEANAFCQSNSYPQYDSQISFGRRMLPLIRDGKLLKRQSNGIVYYSKPGAVQMNLIQDE